MRQTVAMPIRLEWPDIALRLACTLAAAFVIGLNRGEHGRPAGLRTTMLVSLAASVAMILSNSLLGTAGRPEGSFISLDLMRLPLGILTGMGFIGAGAIMRRDNMVVGVTTAATLWFVTVLGLCFGAGQIWFGAAGSILGVGILSGLKRFELSLKQDRQATLVLGVAGGGPGENDFRSSITAAGFRIGSCSVVYEDSGESREVTYSLQWRGLPSETEVPEAVRALADRSGVHKLTWTTQTR